MTHRYPFLAPNPPRLSDHVDALKRIEASGHFSNNGPEVRAFEAEASAQLFAGAGPCLAVANATLGLMVAIKDAARHRPAAEFAIVPAMTFAATAQAAMWAGLTPLVADVESDSWELSASETERLLDQLGERVAVVIPYATFGSAIDLDRYADLQRRHNVGVVTDAAASLGTIDDTGRPFGSGAPFACVYSMHATKTFAVAEGGLIHSADDELIRRLRALINFGFEAPRTASLPGLNAKLPEVIATLARARLADFAAIAERRAAVERAYRDALSAFDLQAVAGQRRAPQFMPVLLPDGADRDAIAAALGEEGIGTGHYFSPHLGEQPLFRAAARLEPTPVADALSRRMLSLPLTDAMTADDACVVADALKRACSARPVAASRSDIAEVLVIGGGPAGTALLTAATKRNLLPDFSRGLVLVERDDHVGGGRLGQYAINSDSTAETFLTAVKDNVHPEIAAIHDGPVGRAIARHTGHMGVPLVEAGPLLRSTGQALARVVTDHGGRILTGHEAVESRRLPGGLWSTTLRRRDGSTTEQLSRNLVVATGGHQPIERLATQTVAGAPLRELASGRLMQSDEMLALGGLQKVADLLREVRNPKVVVVGGSTSALTAVALMLRSRPGIAFGPGGITLLHRRPLRPFYHSVEAAHAEGFTDFTDDDICPVSGFVYRLAGFRLEARELVLRMLEVDGRAPDPRVRLHRISGEQDGAAREAIVGADLVIAALGYRPHAFRILDEAGRQLDLAAAHGRPMVDPHCRVVDGDGSAVPGLYGIGLAAGFVPWGALGGEKSFRGQANGLWLWQNDVGLMIVDQILEARVRAAA